MLALAMTPADRLRAALARALHAGQYQGPHAHDPDSRTCRRRASDVADALLADPDFEAALAEALWASGYVASGQSLGRVIIERLRA